MEEIATKISLAELASILSIQTSKIGINDIDSYGLEVLAPDGYKRVSSYVVKEPAEGWKLGDLLATSVHRVLDTKTKTWKYVSEMEGAVATGKQIEVVDIEVPDGECYLANGWVNHNTTPGGWNIS